MTVEQILSCLEKDPPSRSTDIVILPPDDDSAVSDEDSDDDEEGGPKDPNHVGRRLMNQQAELETHHTHDSDDEIDSWTREKDHMGRMRVAKDEAVLDNTMVVPGPSSSNPMRQNPKRRVVDPPISLESPRIPFPSPSTQTTRAGKLVKANRDMQMTLEYFALYPLLMLVSNFLKILTIIFGGRAWTSSKAIPGNGEIFQ